MNLVVRKKQIVLGALVLGLGLAVYVNYQFSQPEGLLTVMNENTEEKHFGDAQLVDATPLDTSTDGEAYFAQAKVLRQQSRDESVETLTGMLENAQVDANLKAEMALKAAELAQSIETEGKIENLIKAKGFEECMVYYDTQGVDVVVRTEGLDAAEVAQMKDIILKETSVPVENISIVEIN